MTPTQALIEAAEAMMAKLEQIEPSVNAMIGVQFARTGWQYDGPNYAQEKDALKTAISSAKAAEEGVETPIDAAVRVGRELGKKALYFGCWRDKGHFLHDTSGLHVYCERIPDFPWNDALMDTGLLKNRNVPDVPSGKVYWTCGGKAFWYAFYWWDRSVDQRGACNSGFYVRGFGNREAQEAFDWACTQFPHVVERQKYPLQLQNPAPTVISVREKEGSSD